MALDTKELEIVVDAMEERKYKTGDAVIKQGDEGDNLYVIEIGTLDCFRKFVRINFTSIDSYCRSKALEDLSTRRSLR